MSRLASMRKGKTQVEARIQLYDRPWFVSIHSRDGSEFTEMDYRNIEMILLSGPEEMLEYCDSGYWDNGMNYRLGNSWPAEEG